MSNKKRIFITGASGFLASHLIANLSNQHVELFGISDLLPEEEVKDKLTDFTVLDIREKRRLKEHISKIRPSIVFHLAALTNVAISWQHPALTYEINLGGSSNIIEALSANPDSCKIVLLSTAELYGFQPDALREDSPLSSRSPYALSKWAMEKLPLLFLHHPHLTFLTIRAFNFTGPGQSANFVASDFARQIARIELGLAKPEIEVGNLSAERDFSDVRDISRYIWELSMDQRTMSDTINLCSGCAFSIQKILDQLLSYSKQKIQINIDPQRFRPVDNPVMLGDNARLSTVYGLRPQYQIETTLKDLLEYWRTKERKNQG